MDKNLHDIDDIFNKVYQQYEDEPSDGLWEKLNARLDKEDASKYKKRFIGWKRAAILLLFLLSGIILYESRVVLISNKINGFGEKDTLLEPVLPFNEQKNTSYKPTINAFNKPKYPKQNNVISIPDGTGVIGKKVPSLPEPAFINRPKKNDGNIPKLSLSATNLHFDDSNGKKISQIRSVKELEKATIFSEQKEEIISKTINDIAKESYPSNKKYIDKIQIERIRVFDSAETNLTFKDKPLDSNTKILKTILISDPVVTKPFVSEGNKIHSKPVTPYWTLTGYTSLDKSEYNLNNDLPDNIAGIQSEKDQINNREKHELSFSAGVIATRQLSRHFGFKTGIFYSHTSISIDPQEMYATIEPDGSIGYKYITSSGYSYVKPKFGLAPALGDSLQSSIARHNLQSFGIPFQVFYKVDKRKFSIMPSVGISLNFITSATVQTQVKDAFNRESIMINGLNGMKKVYIGLIADINFQYNYNNKWAFNLLPTLRYAITPITQSNVVKTYPYSVGISAGITYKFQK